MPPRASAAEKGKGKAPAGGGAAPPRGPPLADLLSRLSRADLEALLIAHAAAVPTVHAEVLALLAPEQARRPAQELPTLPTDVCFPPAQRKRARTERAAVGGDAALVSSGPFAALDAELTCHILSFLEETADVLRCVLTVCKGWRALRREPELWRRVRLCAPTFSGAGLRALLLEGPRCPLPDAACVRELRIDGGDAVDARAFKAVLARLGHAHTVSLHGKKLSTDCVALLAKPRPEPLKHLTVGKVGKGVDAALLNVLDAHAASLTHLSCEFLCDRPWVDTAAARLKHSALESLRVGERFTAGVLFDGGATVAALSRLGTAFPALRSLELAHVLGVEAYHPPAMPLPAWAPMPALQELRLQAFGSILQTPPLTSARLAAVAGCIAAAAPQLRLLHLSRGEQNLSHSELKAGRYFSPLPAFGVPALGGLGTLLSLEELQLEYVALTTADVAGCHLPALRKLSLTMCGTHAAEAAAALAAAAPALESLTINGLYRSELDGTPGPGVAGLSALHAPDLRSLTLSLGAGRGHYMIFRSRAATDTGAALAAAVRDLAARNACPALRRLEVATADPHLSVPAFFDAATQWPQLRQLALLIPATEVPTSLAALRAPALEELLLGGQAYSNADVTAAVDQMRTQGRAPRLRPLQAPGAAAVVAAAAPEGEGGAGGA